MRYFKTHFVIYGYDKRSSPLCWRACGVIGDFSHIFWDCPKLQIYWKEVMRVIGEILGLNILVEPQRLILGNMHLRGLGENKLYMLRALVLVVHKMITRNWLKPHPPTLDQWSQRVKAVNCMESITAKLQFRMVIYLERWSPVIQYLTGD